MNPKILELRNKKAEYLKQIQALLDKAKAEGRALTTDEDKQSETLITSAKGCDTEIAAIEAQLKKDEERAAWLATQAADLNATTGVQTRSAAVSTPTGAQRETRAEHRDRVLATAQQFGRLKNFPNDAEGRFRAYRFGMWCLAIAAPVIGYNKRAHEYCREQGMRLLTEEGRAISNSHNEAVNYSGGFLVPEEFGNDIIDLREQYGVFPRYAKRIPMKGDTFSRPRREGGLTAYFVAEGGSITASQKTWSRVSMTAKKLAAIAIWTNELNEDAVMNLGDDLAGEIAYAFASKIDDCAFNGDGTSTYGGILGVINKIEAQITASGNVAYCPQVVVASNATWASMVQADFSKMIGQLPVFSDVPGQVAWFCTKTFAAQTMGRLMYSASGNKKDDLTGAAPKEFLGYPIEYVQSMPKVSAATTIECLLANFNQAADYGIRRETVVDMSTHATIGSDSLFVQDGMAIRGKMRMDINVHDIGTWNATAASRVQGPVVALRTP